jgi:plastocyanin
MRFVPALLMIALTLLSVGARADDLIEQHLTLKDHAFTPQNMTVAAGKKIKLTIVNQDSTAAEFESYELHREKVVAANNSIIVFVGPLDPGTYPFFDDFHRDTTTGTIVAK